MTVSSEFATLLTPLEETPLEEADYSTDLAHQHRCHREAVLKEMANAQITLTAAGLHLTAPNRNHWQPNDMASQDFAQMPAAFARDYLRLRLRNFLYETFCVADEATAQTSNAEEDLLINDRLGGGLHVGLLEQFQQHNQGTGFLDPGWTVLHTEADGAIAVQKEGVVVHVDKSEIAVGDRPYCLETQKHPASPHKISIKLPGHRFESETHSGVYIAIGNCGPVPSTTQAVEFYLAAFPIAMPAVMTAVTTALNFQKPMPYTLKVPYRPEDYEGPEAIVLRVPRAKFMQVLPLIEQIWQQHLVSQHLAGQKEIQAKEKLSWLRSDLPVFAEALWPGISAANVIDSAATQWFGSSADLSRTERVAAVLAHRFYVSSCQSS